MAFVQLIGDSELFAQDRNFAATFTAFGMTRRPGRSTSNDPGLTALLAARADAICFVAKAWDYHVRVALETTPEENLSSIRDSVRAAASREHETKELGHLSLPSLARAPHAGAITGLCNEIASPHRLTEAQDHARFGLQFTTLNHEIGTNEMKFNGQFARHKFHAAHVGSGSKAAP